MTMTVQDEQNFTDTALNDGLDGLYRLVINGLHLKWLANKGPIF